MCGKTTATGRVRQPDSSTAEPSEEESAVSAPGTLWVERGWETKHAKGVEAKQAGTDSRRAGTS